MCEREERVVEEEEEGGQNIIMTGQMKVVLPRSISLSSLSPPLLPLLSSAVGAATLSALVVVGWVRHHPR